MTSLMLYVPSFCVSTLQSTQFMSIPFRGPYTRYRIICVFILVEQSLDVNKPRFESPAHQDWTPQGGG